MRKFNGKLFLGLLLGAALCTGTVFGVHHFQYQRIAATLLWQAEHAADQGQVERQARYLAHYLELNPRDDEQKAKLANLWASEKFAAMPKTRLRAMRMLDDILTRSDDHPELQRTLVRLALELNMLQLAREHLEKILPWEQMQQRIAAKGGDRNGKADPAQGELEGFWGQLLERENKQQAEPVPCFRLAIQDAPQLVINYTHLAYLLRRLETASGEERQVHEREANQILDQLVKNNPLAYKAYLARWQYRRDFGLIATSADQVVGRTLLKDAGEDIREALARAPEETAVLLAAADRERLELHAVQGRAEGTQPERDRLIQEHCDKAAAFLDHGLALQHKAPSADANLSFQLWWHKANLILDELRRLEVKELEGTLSAAQVRRSKEREQEASEAIEEIRKTPGLPASADYLRGRLVAFQHRWSEAAALFEHVRPVLSGQSELSSEINLYLARCYEKLEEPGRMLEAYQRLQASDPQRNLVIAELGMAKADWQMGRLDSAARRYRSMIERHQLPDQVWPDVARLEMQRQAQSDEPDWRLAEEALKLAAKASPDLIEVPLLRAQLQLLRNDPAQAERVLQQARSEAKWARSVELRTALAGLAVQGPNPDFAKARAVFEEAEKDLKDSVALRLAKAAYCTTAQKKAEAEKTLAELATNMGAFSETEQANLLSGLGEAQMSLGNYKEARLLCQRLLEMPSRQSDLPLRLVLFDLAMKEEDREGMQSALQDIEKVEGREGAFHSYGNALRLLWLVKHDELQRAEGLEQARAELDRALTQRSSWPAVYLARAEIHFLEGNTSQAINDLREALNNGEKSPRVIRQLVEVLVQNHRYGEADIELKRLRGSLLGQADLGRLAADVALHQPHADLRHAEELIRKAVKSDSKDPRELIWVGRMLSEARKPREAEEKLRLAIKLAPKEPEAYVALVQLLARQERRDDADKVLAQVEQNLGDKKSLILGHCLELLGKQKKAQAQFAAALDARPEDAATIRRVAAFHIDAGQYRDAEPLLRSLAEKKVASASAGDQAWARRYLAVVIANGSDYSRFQEALALVGMRLDSKGQLVQERGSHQQVGTEEQRFQARVLATQQNHRRFRQRAIELLEELDRERALSHDDQFLLGLLYESEGNWSRASVLLRDLVRKMPEPRYVAQLAESLLIHNLPDQAEPWIDRLEELEAQRHVERNTFASLELRARLLEARGQGDEAVEKLKKHVTRPKANPDEILILLASLARQKKYQKAFEMCQEAWDRKENPCHPEVAGGMSVALLRAMSPRPNDGQIQHVEEKLKAVLVNKPNSVVLLLHLSDLYDMRGSYADAEKTYRHVLQVEPNNVVALNNLAWLLVQRSGSANEALQHIDTAISGIGRRADLLDTRGMVRLALGEHGEALADLKDANDDTPTPTRLYHLARAHFINHDRTTAYRILQEAREKGLTIQSLHPIEQQACAQLFNELKLAPDDGAGKKQ